MVIKYVDRRPIFIPKLTFYNNGVTPKFGDELKVTENEARVLFRRRNGTKPCFEEVKQTRNHVKKDINLNDEGGE